MTFINDYRTEANKQLKNEPPLLLYYTLNNRKSLPALLSKPACSYWTERGLGRFNPGLIPAAPRWALICSSPSGSEPLFLIGTQRARLDFDYSCKYTCSTSAGSIFSQRRRRSHFPTRGDVPAPFSVRRHKADSDTETFLQGLIRLSYQTVCFCICGGKKNPNKTERQGMMY